MADGGFLPPEPGGPEPDLGTPPQQRPPPQPPAAAAAVRGLSAAAGVGPAAAAQGWQQPPQQQWAWQPAQPPVPDNGPAVTGFVLSMVAAGLLLVSVGLSSIVSIVCAGLGIFYSRRGRERVDRGETPKHRGLAQAGFISGIITLVLSLLATAFWVLIVVFYATDDEFRQDFDDDLEGTETSLRTAGLCIRSAVALLT